jgi:hypothetical protein
LPIEIRELVIRATVDPGETRGGGCGGSASKKSGEVESPGEASPESDLVHVCVREVLRILEEKRER